jgi:hypothetical protein
MKTKSSILVLVAVTAVLRADPPQAPAASGEDHAKRKVGTEILARISTWGRGGRFSRAMPTPSHRLEFQPQKLVKDETRLPFTIIRWEQPEAPPEWQGYVRLSDLEIFLFDPKTGKHRPAKEHPRFAPPPKTEPAKPL